MTDITFNFIWELATELGEFGNLFYWLSRINLDLYAITTEWYAFCFLDRYFKIIIECYLIKFMEGQNVGIDRRTYTASKPKTISVSY
jgi:hypothetical protein